jgi:hypothetical protein
MSGRKLAFWLFVFLTGRISVLNADTIGITGLTQITGAVFYDAPAANSLASVTIGGVTVTPHPSILNEAFAGVNAPQYGPDIPGTGGGFGSDSTVSGGGPLILDFDQPVAAFGATFVHVENVVSDPSFIFPVTLQVFSGLDGTGTLLGTITDSPGGVTVQGAYFADFRGIWSSSLNILSAVISGTPPDGGFLVDGYAVSVIPSAASPGPLPIPEVETGAILNGYVIVTPDAGTATPLTTLTFGIVNGGLAQSQAAILSTPLTMDTSLQVDVLNSAGRNVGLAVANAGDTVATITATLRDNNGTTIGSPASIPLVSGQQWARFVTELFPASTLGASFQGSLEIQSATPFSVVGLRFSGIDVSTLPVVATIPAAVPLRTPSGAVIGGPNAIMFPQFVMGGGWATSLGLVNNTSGPISGRIDIFDPSGNPMSVKLNGTMQSTFVYSIPAKGAVTFAPRDANGQSPF